MYEFSRRCALCCWYARVSYGVDYEMYRIVKLGSKDRTVDLFPYDRVKSKPSITYVGKEFLLVTSLGNGSGMGVFVNASGDAVRGTLSYDTIPSSIGISILFTF